MELKIQHGLRTELGFSASSAKRPEQQNTHDELCFQGDRHLQVLERSVEALVRLLDELGPSLTGVGERTSAVQQHNAQRRCPREFVLRDDVVNSLRQDLAKRVRDGAQESIVEGVVWWGEGSTLNLKPQKESGVDAQRGDGTFSSFPPGNGLDGELPLPYELRGVASSLASAAGSPTRAPAAAVSS